MATTNDARAGTLSATVPLAATGVTLLATESGPSGDNGDYTATDLSPAGSWQVSAQTGNFTWSYPLRTPPGLGGPEPSLALNYSSGSVDGRTGATNNQGGWVGDGWSMWPGYIERKYASCSDDNPSRETGDLCWFSDNATLSLNGKSNELIRSGNVWRLKNDDGTKIERSSAAARDNGDNDNEHWKVTTTDGVIYYFGYHKLPGWSSGKPVTDSTWTVPVYGNNVDEPCENGAFANSWCRQAWRWNLDYVVDPNNNAMAYYYGKETGGYGRNLSQTARETYHRGGWLQRIEYGMRSDTIFTQTAPLRVVFGTEERCLTGCWSGTAWQSDPVKSAWRDTPWDLYCTEAPCEGVLSPSFWSARRLTGVTTQVRNGTSTYRTVESWSLNQEFLSAGTGEGIPMWLRGITRTGHVTTAGGAAVTDPEITFNPGAEPLPNRVDGPQDQRTALNRWRIKQVRTESGGDILITYSDPECVRSALPTPHTNTKRCMPAYFSWPGTGAPTIDWFHKYVVSEVNLDDLVTDQPTQTTYYDYLDTPAWHYSQDEITKDKHRTWGEWRGYGRVRVRQGHATGQQTAVEYRYLRGMHGDRLLNNATRSVSVPDTWGGSITDHEALAGFLRQEITFNGPGGAEVSSTRNDPWQVGPTATRTRNSITTNAYKVDTGTVRTRTALAAGGYRATKVTTGFNTDGLPTTVDDAGDENVTGDETCTRLSYARNDGAWLIDRVSQAESLSVSCGNAANPAVPSSVLSRVRTFYDTYVDGGSFGAAATRGNPVRTEELDRWNGSTPVYTRTSTMAYDAHGRATAVTDARGHTTDTEYTTAHGGLVTQTKVTNPLGHETTAVQEPAWASPTKVTDPNGVATDLTYDGLGRLTNVWLPGRLKATQSASMKFAYAIRGTNGPTAVTTQTLLPTGTAYRTSIDLHDGFLRLRQNQLQATGGGRLLTETFHTASGAVDWTSQQYYDTTDSSPGTTLGAPEGAIPSVTDHVYDGAGRETATIFKANGVEQWRTTMTYGGDRVHTTPPDGGTATTAIFDVRNRTTALRQYVSAAVVGSTNPANYHQTSYTYTLLDQIKTVVDAQSNAWSYTYDLRNRQIETSDPDSGTTTTTFDAAGNVLTTSSPVGSTVETVAYTYDELGRRTSMRDDGVAGPMRAQWTYDATPMASGTATAKGLPTASIRYEGGSAYSSRINSYDGFGRPTSNSTVLPSAQADLCVAAGPDPCVYTSTTAYWPNGKPLRTTLPAAGGLPLEQLTHSTNDIGGDAGLFSSAAVYAEATYTKYGMLDQRMSGPFGSRLVVDFDTDEPTRRRTGMNVVPEGKNEIADYSYSYDDAGNVLRIREEPEGQTADTQCYEYDHLRQLVEAWTPTSGLCEIAPSLAGLGGQAPYWRSWDVDEIGNRRSETKHGATNIIYQYAYPESGPGAVRPHAVNSVTASGAESWSRTYAYDDGGNMKSRPGGSGGTQTLTWNREGKLVSQEQGTASTSYLYDADGNRLMRTDPTGKTLYLPNGMEIRKDNGAGAAKATRYYRHVGEVVAVRTASALHWIVSDHHGTAELTIDAATLVVAKRRTLPYGEYRGSATGSWPAAMDKGFVGGTADGTGLTHLGAREYDPFLGRFISVDPLMDLTNPQQWHGYSYARNSPVTYVDPDGLRPLITNTEREDEEWYKETGEKVVASAKGGFTTRNDSKRTKRYDCNSQVKCEIGGGGSTVKRNPIVFDCNAPGACVIHNRGVGQNATYNCNVPGACHVDADCGADGKCYVGPSAVDGDLQCRVKGACIFYRYIPKYPKDVGPEKLVDWGDVWARADKSASRFGLAGQPIGAGIGSFWGPPGAAAGVGIGAGIGIYIGTAVSLWQDFISAWNRRDEPRSGAIWVTYEKQEIGRI
ncbi:RHS repeat-associated core domain-containing protein [Micromonospora sp. NBC_01813]|uniref:RHS repeat-associated core domain-containing protein n=1 Tax=Micromonospora sp. NBC_01813 TaxID=2975988 RepID=UPI002DD89499|nr:RHS repeat-associated core domain-containing protein [Micromonospora sp. NBC_01813]WSA08978.1 hypothetical protein OG958_33300 [Micromonospora sp. NBC_01813]